MTWGLFAAAALSAAVWLASRARLSAAGKRALEKLPDTIEFVRVPEDEWWDREAAERVTKPLLRKGFADLGVYAVFPLSGFKLGVLVNEMDKAAAFVSERPRHLGISLELNARYEDGTTFMLVDRSANGVPAPPFFRVVFDPSGTPSGQLYERFLRERPQAGIKAVTEQNVFGQYQAAWTSMARWQKTRGLSAEETGGIARRCAHAAVPGVAAEDGSADFPGAGKPRDTIEIDRRSASLRLSWRWGRSAAGAYFLFVFAFFWCALAHFLTHLGEAGRVLPADDYAFLLAGVFPGLAYAYAGAAILWNRTEVLLEGGRLKVRRGPLPWPGSRDLDSSLISGIYAEGYVSHEGRGGGGTFYEVKLSLTSGEEIRLLGGLSSPARAEFVSGQLRDRLGL